ncbi:Uncharacterized protein YktB, UPF0637 family [Melghirimyces thermohalophilus]|uniref:UPF0637 protein SAMN04488112_101131 n=2 Tax=Melghirimyces thermohalophilus TaxID=1236220 RepID=A0A1G6HQ91_9BACL|nr:Uncharacterized protein YktB, UPF0637 family [Melghirimyces thermohalophilus]
MAQTKLWQQDAPIFPELNLYVGRSLLIEYFYSLIYASPWQPVTVSSHFYLGFPCQALCYDIKKSVMVVKEMSVKGFNSSDFEVFALEGLEPRMEALKENIRPKLQQIGETIAPDLSKLTGEEMFVHVAKHARRTVHPPDETWVAWSGHKRGYKSQPHFQVGLRRTQLFAMFAIIYEYPNKPEFAQNLMGQLDELLPELPPDFVVSKDHTQPEVHRIGDLGYDGMENVLKRLREVKKAEFLCGRIYDAKDPILQNGDQLVQGILETFRTLDPLYRLASFSR